jgi:hypothetical protein
MIETTALLLAAGLAHHIGFLDAVLIGLALYLALRVLTDRERPW